MAMWNPWRGCKKCSDGYLHCYIHKGDAKRGIVTDNIVKAKDFEKPIERLKNGSYKMKTGIVYTCFSTDFLIEEADEWRKECWSMIRERSDCTFLFITKRIERLFSIEEGLKGIPEEKIRAERTEKSVPLLNKYWELMQTVSAPGGSKLYQAVNYSLNHKTELEGYLADGRIEMTNNRAERAVKPFVIARKNFLFSDTSRGAEASALCFSMIE